MYVLLFTIKTLPRLNKIIAEIGNKKPKSNINIQQPQSKANTKYRLYVINNYDKVSPYVKLNIT